MVSSFHPHNSKNVVFQFFLRSICNIQSDVINFQHVLTSFVVFQSFTDLFRELNDREIENHYKMNSENVEAWHGIIISPTQHGKKSREGLGENWTHLVYILDNLFRSIRVSDENSSVTWALHFFHLFELQTFLRSNAPFKATSSIVNTF